MNKKIVGLLRFCKDNPVELYAAERIEELQKQNAELKELVRLAVVDLELYADCDVCKPTRDLQCESCIGDVYNKHIDEDNWQWQHADKARELGVEL